MKTRKSELEGPVRQLLAAMGRGRTSGAAVAEIAMYVENSALWDSLVTLGRKGNGGKHRVPSEDVQPLLASDVRDCKNLVEKIGIDKAIVIISTFAYFDSDVREFVNNELSVRRVRTSPRSRKLRPQKPA